VRNSTIPLSIVHSISNPHPDKRRFRVVGGRAVTVGSDCGVTAAILEMGSDEAS
jgi:hypothetical protein